MSKAEMMRKAQELANERIRTKPAKYQIDEPVVLNMDQRKMRAFVRKSYKGESGRNYYDLILLEPFYKGSAVLHNVIGVTESRLSK